MTKVKILSLVTILLFLVQNTHAQQDSSSNKFKILLGKNLIHGGYGASSIGYTKIGNTITSYEYYHLIFRNQITSNRIINSWMNFVNYIFYFA